MKNYQSKYFGEINPEESGENYFEGEIEFDDDSIVLEFEVEQDLKQDNINRIDNFLDHFQANYFKIKEELKSRLHQTGFVYDYISIIEDDFKKDIRDLLKGTNPSLKQEERLFSLLYVCRIEFLQNDNRFAILDFTIDEGITNDLLVVGIDESSNVVYTFIES